MKAVRLKTEYLTDPLGIDLQHPRLFWNCEGGVRQTAYQIVCDQWDSGRVLSCSMHADYPLPLADRERVTWKVRLWDENDVPDEWSEPACFEMGISRWDASWITGNYSVNKKQKMTLEFQGSTKRLCQQMSVERRFIKALKQDIVRYKIHGNELILLAADDLEIMRFTGVDLGKVE